MENGVSSTDITTVLQPRLIPHVVSHHAAHNPEKIWGSLPKSDHDVSHGYEDITFARLNYAISRACRWLMEAVEPHRKTKSEPLAYIGPPDSRYIILAIAAIKTGFQMLFLSPRNSDEAQQSVICEASCQKFLCSQSMETRIRKLIQSRSRLSNMSCYVVPEQQDLLKDEFVPDYPYDKTLEQARYEPLVTLHTSSTTGMPKTIPLNQGYGLHEDVVQSVSKHEGLDIITRKPFYGRCRMFVAMPLFHAGGVLLTLLKSIYHDIVSVFQPPLAALNSEVFDGILRHGKCTGCVIPPYLLEDMLAVPAYFDTLASLDFVQFGSGPLSQAAGAQLLTRQKDCPHYIGSSECGLYILLELDDPIADWQYFRFHPWSGTDMRPLDDQNDMPRELFIVRTEEGRRVPGMQPVFELFPELEEWPTKDLYVRHPTKPDHWRCIGRNDDVIVLSNGEKLNPVDTEGRVVNSHSNITGALVVGQGRFAPALLLEVRDLDVSDASQRASLIDEIWPSIQAANKEAAGHGQLSKALILFTSPSKPFLRTPKLSVRRKPTIDSYASEIEQMYSEYTQHAGSEESHANEAIEIDLSSPTGILDFIRESIASVTGWEDLPQEDEDLFMLGMDSLQAVRIARAIKMGLARKATSIEFTPRQVYSNPTMTALSEEVGRLASSATPPTSDRTFIREEAIEKLIKEYSNFDVAPTAADMTSIPSHHRHNEETLRNIILTGTTGSLGSYILISLLQGPSVHHIYCLNRSKVAREQFLDFVKGLCLEANTTPWLDTLDQRVSFFCTPSLGLPCLGLEDKADYATLMEADVTHIIHNAWPVNFNLSLASFASHIAGIRALVEFCCQNSSTASASSKTVQIPSLIFVSSLSSVTSLSSHTQVPEAIAFDTSAPAHTGYGESKYVAERVLNEASRRIPILSTTVLRVGQIAGPVRHDGTWPAREWLPSLVISSKAVGALPIDLGKMNDVDWVPVDLLADCISEIVSSSQVQGSMEGQVEDKEHASKVYHVLNPNIVSWQDLLPTIQQQTCVSRTVPLRDWIELVREQPGLDEDTTASTEARLPNPAKKILQFYEALDLASKGDTHATDQAVVRHEEGRKSRYELRNMASVSDSFRRLEPVSNAWMAKWVGGWL